MKLELVETRGRYTLGIGRTHPVCPICDHPITAGPDLHEALITRGLIQGAGLQELTYHRCNVVLRHHVCPDKQYHTPGRGGMDTFRKCVVHLCEWEGTENVREYLQEIIEKVPVLIDILRQFETVVEEEKL